MDPAAFPTDPSRDILGTLIQCKRLVLGRCFRMPKTERAGLIALLAPQAPYQHPALVLALLVLLANFLRLVLAQTLNPCVLSLREMLGHDILILVPRGLAFRLHGLGHGRQEL